MALNFIIILTLFLIILKIFYKHQTATEIITYWNILKIYKRNMTRFKHILLLVINK